MADIKVHLLNFHGLWSHIHIVLENTSTEPHTFYDLNRWAQPKNEWSEVETRNYIERASSVYSFHIKAKPEEIIASWNRYWIDSLANAGIFSENCAMAVQWFLSEFAGIPKPSLSNVSLNYFAFGIVWPSFIPFPLMLPGRVISNATFHLEARNHPEIAAQYSRLFLYTSMALAILAFSASTFTLAVAATVLTGGIAGSAITGCVVAELASSYGFFKAYNLLSAKNISDELKKSDEPLLLN